MNKIKGKFIFNFSRDLLLVLVVACFAFSFLFASQAQAFSDSDCDSGDLTTTCTVTSTKILSAGEVISGDNLVIDSSGELTTGYNSDNHYYNSFQINMSGDVTLQNGGVITGNVEINTDNLNIASSSAIDVSDKGYAGGERVCGGSSGGSSGYGAGAGGAGNEISGGGGAGYGGLGGNGFNSSDGGSVYGQASTTDPFSYGSGGGSGGISEGGDDQCSGAGGAGGGLVKIVASSSLVLNGNIWANGEDGKNGSSSVAQGGGGGSGGSVWIETPSVSGTGSIQAEGGNGGDGDISPSGGGGAGGRIALGKSPIFSSLTVSSDAGSGYEAGERGSLYYDFSGTYTSEVLDFSSPRDFTTINISKTEPATNTSVTVYLRAGSTTTPDESWTDWMEVSDGSDISSTSDNRYLQYKTELSLQATGTIPQNLSLDSINISYNSYNITTVTDWARRVKIGIDPDKVDGDLNSFPLLLTEDNLPAEIFNRAQADACDLRFSTDSALDNELAFEIVSFDSASSTAEIWVKIPSLSSSATTSFYAWYGNNSAQCYASSSTYGSQNVWSDKYVGVWHLGDDSASTTDSSPNNNGGECYNTDDWYDTCPALIEGKIGKAHYWDNNQEDQIDIPNSDSFNVDSLSVQLWAKVETTTDEYQILLSKDNIWGMGVDYENKAGWGTEYSLLLGNEVSNSDFDFFVGTYDTPSIQKFYQNGVEVASDTYPPTSLSNNSSDFVLGGGEFPYSLPEGDNRNFYGTMDEVRVLNTVLSADWVATEYNNQSFPSTFVITEEPEDTSPSLTSSPFNTTDSTNFLRNLSWSQTVPATSTDIKLQLRTSADGANWTSWLGPDGTSNTFFNDSHSSCSQASSTVTCDISSTSTLGNGIKDQYVQYKAHFITENSDYTPTLNSVDIDYEEIEGGATYNITGTYTSEILDISRKKNLTIVDISKTEPTASTTVNVYLRAGNTATPDGNWSSWAKVTDGADISALAGSDYLQYKAELNAQSTGITPQSPNLDSISFNYASYAEEVYWNKRAPLTIDSDKVAGDLTDFPVLLTEDNLPAEIFSQAQSDGCDIRFSTDSDMDNEIPFEIVGFNSTSSTAEIWAKVPEVASTSSTTIYVWYDNPSADCYSESDTYGSENVWDDYVLVTHMNDYNSTHIVDSSGKQGYLTKIASDEPIEDSNAQIGKSQLFDGSNDHISLEQTEMDKAGHTTNWTISIWLNSPSSTSNMDTIVCGDEKDLMLGVGKSGDDSLRVMVDGESYRDYDGVPYNDNSWHYITAVKYQDSTEPYLYMDKSQYYNSGGTGTVGRSGNYYIGKSGWADGGIPNAYYDEIRVSKYNLSKKWHDTEYNNQNSPSTFISVGDPVSGLPNFVSSPYNTTDSANAVRTLSWQETIPATGTDVKLQLRTSPDGNNWTSWLGPDGSEETYFNENSTNCSKASSTVTCNINQSSTLGNNINDQYIQYKAFLVSDSGNFTPTLNSVTLDYEDLEGSEVYDITGTYTSEVLDFSSDDEYATVDISKTEPTSSTTVTVYLRGGNTDTPDGSWTSWTEISDGSDIYSFSGNRYLQYKAGLEAQASGTIPQNPSLDRIRFNYGAHNAFAWSRSAALSIDPDKVEDDLVDFPVLLTEENLPAELFSYAQTDACDLRFSTDSGLSAELPFEIAEFDKLNNEAEVWVKVPEISSSSPTTIYVWYGNNNADCYKATSTYGAQNVWESDYKMVAHNGGSTDSTGNGNNGTAKGGVIAGGVDGRMGVATDFDGSDDWFEIDELSAEIDSLYTVSAWINGTVSGEGPDGYGRDIVSFHANNYNYTPVMRFNVKENKLRVRNEVEQTALSDDTWHYVTMASDGDKYYLYADGEFLTSGGEADSIPDDAYGNIGQDWDYGPEASDFFQGIIDETRLSAATRTPAWIKTEYNNQNSPSAFVSVATPTPADFTQNFTSSPYNTISSTNFLQELSWTENIPATSTDIKFQLRTSGNGSDWTDWLGPDGTNNTYFNDTHSDCSKATSTVVCSLDSNTVLGNGINDQYVQYKAYLTAESGTAVPTLSSVVLDHEVLDGGEVYNITGTYTSEVLDFSESRDFTTVDISKTEPGASTSVAVYVRGGATGTPDETWSAWTEVADGDDISTLAGNRYLQYKVELNTQSNGSVPENPSLEEISFNYDSSEESGPFLLNFLSSPYNTTNSQNFLREISWEEDISASSTSATSTDIKFQLRTSSDGNSWTSWLGPDGTANTYFNDIHEDCSKTGTSVTCAIDEDNILGNGVEDKYIQYSAYLIAESAEVKPTLNNVDLNYENLEGAEVYNITGTYTSEVLDFSEERDFTTVDISKTEPNASTTVTVYVRGGATGTPDGTWSAWTEVTDGADISTLAGNRYLQYRAELNSQASDSLPENPSLEEISFNYDPYLKELKGFSSGWNKRVSLAIDPDKVAGDLTDFPVLLTEDNLPAEIFSQAQSDGCDIRFSTDSDMDNEIPFEIVGFNISSSSAEIWARVPEVASTSSTTIYVWYGNSSAECYASSSTYGAQNVWTNNYKLVYHNVLNDSSPNGYEGTNSGATLVSTGKIGDAHDFEDSNNYIQAMTATEADTIGSDFAVSTWFYPESTSGNSSARIVTRDCSDYWCVWLDQSTAYPQNLSYYFDNNSKANFSDKVGQQWNQVFASWNSDNSQSSIYINGELLGNYSTSGFDGSSRPIVIGDNTESSPNPGSSPFYGLVDEFRIYDSNITSEWVATEYNNQNSPSTFISVGDSVSRLPNFVSSPYNTTDSANALRTLSWQETIPATGTDVKLQLRTSPDGNNWTSWLGPDGSEETYFNENSTNCSKASSTVTCSINSTSTLGNSIKDQYVQYRASLVSVTGGHTPTLNSVNLGYEEIEGTIDYDLVGNYTSEVLDFSQGRNFSTVNISKTEPTSSTTVTVYLRGGNTATPDETWTSWTEITDGADISSWAGNRYLQYKIELTAQSSGSVPQSPGLDEITFNYGSYDFSFWNRRVAINVDPGKVTSTLTNFPMLLTEDNLPAEVFTRARTDGCDLRFSTDSAMTQEIPFELVSFNATTSILEAWVKVPELSSTATTTIYAWYGNSSAECYSSGSAYGSENVWGDEYVGVWHLEEDSGPVFDSTGNGHSGTFDYTLPTPVAGKIGGSHYWDGFYDNVYITDTDDLDPVNITLEAWVESSYEQGQHDRFVTKDCDDNWCLRNDSGNIAWVIDGSSVSGSSTSLGEYTFFTGTYDTQSQALYQDGSQIAINNSPTSSLGSNNKNLVFGANVDNVNYNEYQGVMDEIRVLNSALSAEQIATEYNNQNSPSTFASAGDPEEVSLNLVSSVYDSLNELNTIRTLSWEEMIPATSTDIKLQLRASRDGDNWTSWKGPDGTINTYFNDSHADCSKTDSAVTCSIDGSTALGNSLYEQYVQYRAFIVSTNGRSAPTLNSVTLGYEEIEGEIEHDLNGTYTSEVLDFIKQRDFTTADISKTEPTASTSVQVYLRGGASSTPNGTWTSWTEITDGQDISSFAGNRYLQYRAEFSTQASGEIPANPSLDSISFNYGSYGLQVAPSWSGSAMISVDPEKVSADLTDFPMLLTEKSLPDNIFSQAKFDACDIRFSTDMDKNNEIPFEIVGFNPNSGKAEIWVKVPELSSTDPTVIYLWYGNDSAQCYDTDSTYGSENVWNNNYAGVWHLEEDFGTVYDSTSNNNDGSFADNLPNPTEGIIGGSHDFSDGGYVYIPNSNSLNPENLSVEIWKNSFSEKGEVFPLVYKESSWGLLQYSSGDWSGPMTDAFLINSNMMSAGTYAEGFLVGTYDTLSQKIYRNGVLKETDNNPPSSINASSSNLIIGGNDYISEGILDEARVLNTPLSADWITTEYNNQSSPSTFATVMEGFVGAFTSSVFDSKYAKTAWANVSWSETAPTSSDVKVKLRTSPDGNTWTEWLGPGATTTAYFNDSHANCSKMNSAVSCDIDSSGALGDGSNDRYLQYKVYLVSETGIFNPLFSSIAFNYANNTPPEFKERPSANQNLGGKVSINYSIRDIDTDLGSITPGYVTPSFEYSLDGGVNWQSATSTCFEDGDWANKAVSASDWTDYTATWTPSCESGIGSTVYSTSTKIRITIDDNEIANNIVVSTTPAFVLDSKAPVLGEPPVYIDARLADSQAAPVYLSASDDNSVEEMRISLDPDFSAASWTGYNTSSSVNLATNPDTVYVQFRDEYHNISSDRADTPDTPQNLTIQDSSDAPDSYELFLTWQALATEPGPGFDKYRIYRSTSADPETLSLQSTISNMDLNYWRDIAVTASTTYYYAIASLDKDGNESFYSSVVSATANGIQDEDEEEYEEEEIPPVISNVEVPQSSIYSDQVTVYWDTDEPSDSLVSYSTNPGSFTNHKGAKTLYDQDGNLGRHQITLTNLNPDTTYYFMVESTDVFGNTSTSTQAPDGYTFITTASSVISNINVSDLGKTSAQINWVTDIDTDSQVTYSVNSDLSNPTSVEITELTTQHNVELSGLSEDTTYYYKVESTDINGNTTVDDNEGDYYSFTTKRTLTFFSSYPGISLLADTYAKIDWETNIDTRSRLYWGTASGDYTEQISETEFTQGHSLTLDGLSPETTYYYYLSSEDLSGNTTSTSEYSFTTNKTLVEETEEGEDEKEGEEEEVTPEEEAQQGGGGIIDKTDSIPPDVSKVEVLEERSESVVISWQTNEPTLGLIEVGETSEYEGVYGGDAQFKTDHTARIKRLDPETTYNFRINSFDTWGNLRTSANRTFTTVSREEEEDEESEYEEEDIEEMTEQDKEKTIEELFREADRSTRQALDILLASDRGMDYFRDLLSSQYDSISQFASEQLPAPFFTTDPEVITTARSAIISWTTNEETNSLVNFARENEYNPDQDDPYIQVAGNPDERVNEHRVTLHHLEPDTLYHYQLRSRGDLGPEANSRDFTFRTEREILEIRNYTVDKLNDQEAIFKWTTNVEADTAVTYTPYRDNKLSVEESETLEEDTVTTIHNIKVDGLEAGVVYEVELVSEDLEGNTARRRISAFSTTEDNYPPSISQIETETAIAPGKRTQVQAIISWKTNELSTSRVYYNQGVVRPEEEMEYETKLDDNYTRRHVVVITDFEPGTPYSFRVESIDSSGNTSLSRVNTILSPQREQSIFELILRHLENIFGWLGRMR